MLSAFDYFGDLANLVFEEIVVAAEGFDATSSGGPTLPKLCFAALITLWGWSLLGFLRSWRSNR